MSKPKLLLAAVAASLALAVPAGAQARTVNSAGRADARYCRYFDRGGSMPAGVQEHAFFAAAWLRDQIKAGNRKARRKVLQIRRNHPACPMPLIPRSVFR